MANYKSGNLAYEIDDSRVNSSVLRVRSSALPEVPYEIPSLPDRRREEYEREKRRRELAEQERRLAFKSLYKATGIERNTTIAISISILLIIVGMFAFLMMRQANVVEKNFEITRLQNQIVQLQNENADEYEDIISKVNLSEVEEKAYQIYGLRRPAQAQRIYVDMPGIDRVIRYDTRNNDAEEVQDETDAVVFDASQIELYMKKLRTQE